MTAQDIIESQMPIAIQKRPTLVAEINQVIHWNILGEQGGQWTMDLTRNEDCIENGLNGKAALKITITDSDFVLLRQGQLNGMMAVMTGKLKFEPMNLSLAMKVAQLMGK